MAFPQAPEMELGARRRTRDPHPLRVAHVSTAAPGPVLSGGKRLSAGFAEATALLGHWTRRPTWQSGHKRGPRSPTSFPTLPAPPDPPTFSLCLSGMKINEVSQPLPSGGAEGWGRQPSDTPLTRATHQRGSRRLWTQMLRTGLLSGHQDPTVGQTFA